MLCKRIAMFAATGHPAPRIISFSVSCIARCSFSPIIISRGIVRNHESRSFDPEIIFWRPSDAVRIRIFAASRWWFYARGFFFVRSEGPQKWTLRWSQGHFWSRNCPCTRDNFFRLVFRFPVVPSCAVMVVLKAEILIGSDLSFGHG